MSIHLLSYVLGLSSNSQKLLSEVECIIIPIFK